MARIITLIASKEYFVFAISVLSLGVITGIVPITVAGMTACAVLIFPFKPVKFTEGYIYLIALTSLFWVPFLWLLVSDHKIFALIGLETSLLFLVMPLVIFLVPVKTDRFLLIGRIYCFMVSGIYLLLLIVATYKYFYVQHPWGIQTEFFFYTELANSIFEAHPLYLGLAGVFASVLSIFVFGKNKKLILSYLVFNQIVITLLNGRVITVVHGIIFIVILIQIILRNGKKSQILAGVTIVLILIIGLVKISNIHAKPNRSYFVDIKSSIERSSNNIISETDNGFTVRLAIWQNAYLAFKESPLFGHGTRMEREALMKQYNALGYAYLLKERFTSHNQFIFYLIEYGIVGFSIIIICFGYLLMTAWSKSKYLYVVFIAIFIVVSITESYFNRIHGVMLFSFINSVLYLKYIKNE